MATRIGKTTRMAAVFIFGALVLSSVTGCSDQGPDPETETVTKIVVADFSDSAQAENGSDLNDAARNDVMAMIDEAEDGTTIKVIGFSNRPGQECDPITVSFPAQENPESAKQLRKDAAADLTNRWAEYSECLRDPVTGMSSAGSGIFGAVVLAATTDVDDVDSVVVHTDGCTFGELAPSPETCSGPVLNRGDGPQKLVDSMPAALKPPIALPITFVHLGRGTDLDAQQLLALRRTYALWGAVTGARVTFEK